MKCRLQNAIDETWKGDTMKCQRYRGVFKRRKRKEIGVQKEL